MPGIEQIKHPSNIRGRKRKGYGQGSGLGKTAGRGQKGYGSRSGNTEKPPSRVASSRWSATSRSWVVSSTTTASSTIPSTFLRCPK